MGKDTPGFNRVDKFEEFFSTLSILEKICVLVSAKHHYDAPGNEILKEVDIKVYTKLVAFLDKAKGE